MEFKVDKSWRDYIQAGEATTLEILRSDSPFFTAFDDFEKFFTVKAWDISPDFSPTQSLLAINSYMLLLAGLRLSLSGHEAATFPVFRTALETACYVIFMHRDDKREKIWRNRHKDAGSQRVCRKTFTPAVKKVSAKIRDKNIGAGDHIEEIYQEAISWGAHPNPRALFPHVTMNEVDNKIHVTTIGLYGENSFEIRRSLVACLDFAWAVALVLSCTAGKREENLLPELQRLNDLRISVARSIFE